MHVLAEYAAEHLLEQEGLPVAKRKVCTTLTQAQTFAEKVGYPVVLKVASSKLLHKSEKNSVRLNVTKEKLPKIYKELRNIKIKKEGILVQEFHHGKQVLIGLKKNPTFGHVVVVGLGGIYTEILKDIAIRVAPISKKQAKEMIHELKGHKILEGFRGHRVDTNKLATILYKISRLPKKYPHIEELDINPLIIDEKHAVIVDARIILAKA